MERIAPLRTRAQSTWGPGGPRFPPRWALAHGDYIWRMIGPRPTWVITTLVIIGLVDDVNGDDYRNLYEDHDYSGTWPQWLDSVLMRGRWLDYPALCCIVAVLSLPL
jgi:hypothetical protein